jgi:DNA ligase D
MSPAPTDATTPPRVQRRPTSSTGRSDATYTTFWSPELATPAKEIDVDGIAVRITNPDKVFYPKLGPNGTKGKLIDYYLAVAGGPMLTSLRDRPAHLQRFPDGIDGEEIYQKRVPQHHPDYIATCRITFPSGRTADALKVTHPSAIIWAAQMGAITLHPWQVRCPDTEHPDELRIDLDPQPGTGFPEARAVAVDVLKPLLDELGLVGYAKTSGGRGVHVFLRIETKWDFVEVRRAGIALAREVERRSPDTVTTSWWKEERGNRIFIDFNQNARDRTMASAYSARRTPIATVSTPLTWDELADADPDDYTIATVPQRLRRRGDPWADMESQAQSIDPLLEMAAADAERGLGDMPYPPNYPKMPGEPKRVQPSRDTDLKGKNTSG